jgi:hypothetical protein
MRVPIHAEDAHGWAIALYYTTLERLFQRQYPAKTTPKVDQP